MRVFLDANVLFSASNEGSNVARLIGLARRNHELITSDFALEEAVRNVQLKRPAWSGDLARVADGLTKVPSIVFPLPVELGDKDRPILCAATRAKCDLLVTGDRTHFGHLYGQAIEGVEVVSLVGLAERVVGGGA